MRLKPIPENKECRHPTCGATCRRREGGAKSYRINKISYSQAELLAQYAPLARDYVFDQECEIQLPGCTFFAGCVHHTKGKEGFDTDGTPMLLAVRWWKRSCYSCNVKLEANDGWARENNLKLSKFNDHDTNK